MTPTTSPNLGHINQLLAERGYEITQTAPDSITIRELDSGIAIQAVLEGDILFLTLPCTTVPRASVTADIMAAMLAADNGISTSSFQVYDAGDGNAAITLNNFCKLQTTGPEDDDDVMSCVHFLLVDVIAARRVLRGLVS
ncbi:MAG: hypothetical protein ABI759_20250 [Candidatus Solibacter sp.]